MHLGYSYLYFLYNKYLYFKNLYYYFESDIDKHVVSREAHILYPIVYLTVFAPKGERGLSRKRRVSEVYVLSILNAFAYRRPVQMHLFNF